jgi:alkylation response protein AidB-like acyl-CoA dehydrogenase
MTERAGGSDVSQTETLATYSPESSSGPESLSTDGEKLGPWLINGFKWFSSATDSSMMVFLARTPKGISAFYAPMRRTLPSGPDSMGYATGLNGIQIQRLKQKLGSRALPTAELELKGVRAYLVRRVAALRRSPQYLILPGSTMPFPLSAFGAADWAFLVPLRGAGKLVRSLFTGRRAM